MRKHLAAAAALICCLALILTGCTQKNDTAVDTESEKIPAPYLGYAPLTTDENEKMSVMGLASPQSTPVELFLYDAGENNEAVFRVEISNKDGSWKTLEERTLHLTDNVNKGYMALAGDVASGSRIATSPIQKGGDTGLTFQNIVTFGNVMEGSPQKMAFDNVIGFRDAEEDGTLDEETYLARQYRMSMTEKKALQIAFQSDAEVPAAGINDVYTNRDGKYNGFYEDQKMLALTVEFRNNKLLSDAPYVVSPERADKEYKGKEGMEEVTYDSGLFEVAELCLEKSNKDGTWEIIGEPQEMRFINNVSSGKLKIKGSLKEGKICISTPDAEDPDGKKIRNAASFSISDKKAEGLKTQLHAIADEDGYISADTEVAIALAGKSKDKDTASYLEDIASEGETAASVYMNEDGVYDDLYLDSTMYAVTIKFVQ